MNKMKKYIAISMCACLTMLTCLTSCDDEFLERNPKVQEVEANVFTTYDNFKKYAWSFYNGVGESTSTTASKTDLYCLQAYQGYPQNGDISDMMYYSTDAQSNWNYQGAFGWVFELLTASNVSTPWNFDFVRNVNVLLDNIDGSQMTDEDKAHWRGVGYFFRAHAYFELLKNYGDLPWLEHVVGTKDDDILYGTRDSRELVANNILQNLLYAEENIYAAGDGANTVNPNVVRALISRFGLWEGTWRKYHGSVDGVDGTKYLEASVKASQNLIDQNLGLMNNYDAVFNSQSLANQSSILLYRAYVNESGKAHDITQRSVTMLFEGTKKLVEHYLCSDGRPISTSEVYDGDASVYDEFRNRDYRLYYTVCPPYIEGVNEEYMDLMNNTLAPASSAGSNGKTLPIRYNLTSYLSRVPNIQSVAVSGVTTQTGYYMYKYYNTFDGFHLSTMGSSDAPIFRMGEVLANHAEAMFELGRFNQTVADATINKLRARAGVANMVVANINDSFDTYRDASVDPVLWEIRRERCVELIGSGFRYQDIKRWKKGEYVAEQPVGVKLEEDLAYYSEANQATLDKMKYDGSGNSRYKNCATFMLKPKGWNDKYYLLPIPLSQTVLNPNLGQNPGWTTTE